jgi:hypothetical protein
MLEKNGFKARQMFKDEWKKVQDGFIEEDGSASAVDYHSNDFDHELLVQSDNELILKDTVYETVAALVKAGEEKERIAYANWISMYRKGGMLVKSFIAWVDENVETVLEAQTAIELEDDEGNKVTGLADFVIKIHGYDHPILVDLKTAGRYYERGSVKESEQLALYYTYFKNTKYPTMERAAFLVLNKQIKKNRVKTCKKCGNVTTGREATCANEVDGGEVKSYKRKSGGVLETKLIRCRGEFDVDITPEVVLQYIHDEIPQEFIDATVERFNLCLASIQTGEFEKNLDGCARYYGRECPYAKYCESGCMDGLYKKEDT